MISETVTIRNRAGLHLRPVTAVCETACRFRSDCILQFAGKEANIKSVLSLLAAGLRFGDTVRILCAGPDEKEAMDALLAVFRDI